MRTATVDADGKHEAKEVCFADHGFFPSEIREVDSGRDEIRSWICFESIEDARVWDSQR